MKDSLNGLLTQPSLYFSWLTHLFLHLFLAFSWPMEEASPNQDIPLGDMISPQLSKDKPRWSMEEYPGGQIHDPSVETLLAPSDRSSSSEANSPDEPRVQEPYEVALKVWMHPSATLPLLIVGLHRS